MKLTSNTLGILAGGGGAAAGVVVGKMLSKRSIDAAAKDKKDAPKWATYLAEQPWAGGVAGGVLAIGGLYAAKKKDAILPAFLAHAAVVAPVALIAYLAKADLPAADSSASSSAGSAPAGTSAYRRRAMGVAMASKLGNRPSVTVFGQSKLRLSGTSNTPFQSTNMASAASVPVFGGSAF